jgi:hypothetical protein
MRYLILYVLFFVYANGAHALTPPPDNSPGFFSGEWAGTGGHGAYCYLAMSADGHGVVLIDGGSGDWLGARFHWRNRQQSLEVDTITPVSSSNQLRIMPLGRFTVGSGFNQSLKVTWSDRTDGCNLQKSETTAHRLNTARSVLKSVQHSKVPR